MTGNMFSVGEIASGDKFIGRALEVSLLSKIFETTTSIHLVGATRIGKSSLVEKVFLDNSYRDGLFAVRLDLSIYENAFQFWFSLCEEIADAAECLDSSSSAIKKYSEMLFEMDSFGQNWYARMRRPLTKLLEELKKLDYRVVVAIDEFDAVTRVFEGNPAYYQMLRSLFSEGKYALNGVIVSRRNLEVLEAKTEDVSTFHGVFDTLRLKAFNREELGLFYGRMESVGCSLDDEAKNQFEFFTGGIPYLCCMLANQLSNTPLSGGVRVDGVVGSHRICQPEIWRYYRDLIERLKEDGHLEPLTYLAFDEMRTLSYVHNRDNMIAMGYLVEEKDKNGKYTYYAYSKGFMTYLRRQPLNAPMWDLLSASEKKLKRIFACEFPLFAEIHAMDNTGAVSQKDKKSIDENYPDLRFKMWSQNERFLRDTASYMENPSVLDVLAVTWVIDEIDWFWDKRFSQYFSNDDSWRHKLKEIRAVRNPMAHAHGDCISENDLMRTAAYMRELLNIDL